MKNYFYTLVDDAGGNSIELPIIMSIGSVFEYDNDNFEVIEYRIEDNKIVDIICMEVIS